jgi:hypothetical protein
MMEAARISETLANFYQTTWRYNPEDSHLHTHRRENLKSYLAQLLFYLQGKNSPVLQHLSSRTGFCMIAFSPILILENVAITKSRGTILVDEITFDFLRFEVLTAMKISLVVF